MDDRRLKYSVHVVRPLTSAFYSKNMCTIKNVIDEVLEEECMSNIRDIKGVLQTIDIKIHKDPLNFMY